MAAIEQGILAAMELICEDEENYRRLDHLALEESCSKGIIPATIGGVYFAWSDCLNCMIIGATRIDNPLPRLRELDRHITAPFALVRWMATTTPFHLASIARAHFAAKRVNTAGAGAEFYNINAATVEEYMKRFE